MMEQMKSFKLRYGYFIEVAFINKIKVLFLEIDKIKI